MVIRIAAKRVTGAFELVGLVPSGVVQLDAASTVDGAAVSASFHGSLVRSPF